MKKLIYQYIVIALAPCFLVASDTKPPKNLDGLTIVSAGGHMNFGTSEKIYNKSSEEVKATFIELHFGIKEKLQGDMNDQHTLNLFIASKIKRVSTGK